MTSSLRRTPDRAASDELLLRVHSRRPGRAHAVRQPKALHALTPLQAPATVRHTPRPPRRLETTVLRHLNSPQVLSKDGGKLRYQPIRKKKEKSKEQLEKAERLQKLLNQVEQEGDPLSELASAYRLKRIAGNEIRHAVGLGWMHWDGTYWNRNEKPVWRCAHKLGAAVRKEVLGKRDVDEETIKAYMEHARRLESSSGIRAILTLAQTIEGLDGNSIEWDSHPWLLNVPNGTLDLCTGELRQPVQEDYLTRKCPVEFIPDAQCPRWRQFLAEVFCEDEQLIDYWQWVVGYSLTGCTVYDIFFVLWGAGANGKTTLLRTLQSVLGEDYAQQINPQALMMQRNTQHPTDIAQLRGARMVVAMETAEGNRLDAALVKSLTGGDKIRARFMRQDTFEFTPELKLFMGTNHRPVIKDDSNGMWRRIRLIPFEATFTGDKRDVNLLDKLNEEMPGILAWAVEGAKRVAGGEPTPPARVKAAVDEYRDDQDTVARFIEELCECSTDAVVSKGALYKAYREWSNNHCESQKKFSKRMQSRGFGETRLSRGTHAWTGITLADSAIPDQLLAELSDVGDVAAGYRP